MLAETETFAGPTPEVGDAESQPLPLVVATVKLNAPPPETDSARLCEAGLLAPACAVKVSEPGDTLMLVGLAMFSVTGTLVDAPPEGVTVTVPL